MLTSEALAHRLLEGEWLNLKAPDSYADGMTPFVEEGNRLEDMELLSKIGHEPYP